VCRFAILSLICESSSVRPLNDLLFFFVFDATPDTRNT
jgi:hypothetical protein